MNGTDGVDMPEGMNELRSRMNGISAWRNHRLEWIETTGSTNEDLKAAGDMRFLVAGHQTAGRGQRGRVWTSVPGAGVLFSFTWIWPDIDSAWKIPLRAGLAVRSALLPFAGGGDRLWLKWPNDICLGSGKVGGILIESTVRAGLLHLVVGIGINLRVPGRLADDGAGPGMRAASLDECREPADAVNRWTVLGEFVRTWAEWIERPASGGDALISAYIEAARPFWGRSVCVVLGDGGTVEGRAITLAPGGALEICEKNGGRRFVTDARRLTLVGE